MIGRTEYERLLELFLVELNHICKETDESDIQSNPRFAADAVSYLADIRDADMNASQALRWAFAYVDEFVGANRAKVMEAGYAAYQIDQGRSS